MGLLKKIKKTAKRMAPTNINSGTQLIRDANRTRNEIPTNANDITNNTRRLIKNAPRNVNDITGSLRDAYRTDGRSILTGYKEGTAGEHRKAVAAEQARKAAAAEAAAKAEADRKASVAYKRVPPPDYNPGLQRFYRATNNSVPTVQRMNPGMIQRNGMQTGLMFMNDRAPVSLAGYNQRLPVPALDPNRVPTGPGLGPPRNPIPNFGTPRPPQGRPIASGMASSQNVGMMPQNQKVQTLLNDQRRNSIPQNQAPQNTGVMGPQRMGMAWNPQMNGRPIRR